MLPEPVDESFHSLIADALSLMVRVHCDIDDLECTSAIADDPPHAHQLALPNAYRKPGTGQALPSQP
jgi:hypothetical protein